MRGRNFVAKPSDDVNRVAEDCVGRSDGMGGHGRDGDEEVWP